MYCRKAGEVGERIPVDTAEKGKLLLCELDLFREILGLRGVEEMLGKLFLRRCLPQIVK